MVSAKIHPYQLCCHLQGIHSVHFFDFLLHPNLPPLKYQKKIVRVDTPIMK